MCIEDDLHVSIIFDSSFHEDIIMEEELFLIRSILPEILQEIIAETESNKE
jgi:hypothetical protein